MKTFRTIVAFFQALLPFAGSGFLSLLILMDLDQPYNIIFAVAVMAIGFIVSRWLFNLMRKRGVIAVMSGDNATYDVDELIPLPGDDVELMTAQEFTDYFNKNKATFGNYTIAIYGDWEGRKLDTKHTLSAVEFNAAKAILTLNFLKGYQLKIRAPKSVFTATTYLKVMKAKEVLWQLPNGNQFNYLNSGKTIKTQSNTKWKVHKNDLGVGMNAVYLQRY